MGNFLREHNTTHLNDYRKVKALYDRFTFMEERSSLILRRFGLQEGEGRRTVLMFSYVFLIIASLLVVKPVRNSLFLTKFGPQQLPYAFILAALVSALVASFYARLANRFALNRLIGVWLLFSSLCLLASWALLHSGVQAGWFIYAFYVWVTIFGVISASQFWLLANYVFNAREAKRIFGLLGARGIAGGIFGLTFGLSCGIFKTVLFDEIRGGIPQEQVVETQSERSDNGKDAYALTAYPKTSLKPYAKHLKRGFSDRHLYALAWDGLMARPSATQFVVFSRTECQGAMS